MVNFGLGSLTVIGELGVYRPCFVKECASANDSKSWHFLRNQECASALDQVDYSERIFRVMFARVLRRRRQWERMPGGARVRQARVEDNIGDEFS